MLRLFAKRSPFRIIPSKRFFASTIIDGLSFATEQLQKIKEQTRALTERFRPPGLCVFLVGVKEDSHRYVLRKQTTAEDLGFHSTTVKLPENISEHELCTLVQHHSDDPSIDGVLVQLPLPAHINQNRVLESISPEKDVDGLNSVNMGRLALNNFMTSESSNTGIGVSNSVDSLLQARNISCTAKACMALLDRHKIEVAGKSVVMIGRSCIVGLPLTLLLLQRNASIINIPTFTPPIEMASYCRKADIIISAIGQPLLIKKDWIRPGAVCVDVGISFLPNSHPALSIPEYQEALNPIGVTTVGDFDFHQVKKISSYISPVPNGVGVVTVSMLMLNTLLNAQYFQQKSLLLNFAFR
eukprot:TRINITY_DN6225_c0_g1_i1.p1 TRINITY_DN6225_c0_g1~~TRINITY_DN6225_c0_g1_i1.p1  ORF type:complete len:355 (+),score=38.49 TRINITY_DN6225_c0_g1_i1:170-1234(+)